MCDCSINRDYFQCSFKGSLKFVVSFSRKCGFTKRHAFGFSDLAIFLCFALVLCYRGYLVLLPLGCVTKEALMKHLGSNKEAA